MAIGFPLGTDLPGPATFTKGIVSALRNVDGSPYIQTEVDLPPKNKSSFMLDWKIRKGALDGQKVLHTGEDYQQAPGG